jgi:hypothetical protein
MPALTAASLLSRLIEFVEKFLAFKRQHAAIPEPDDEVGLARAQQRITAELAERGA